MLIRFGVENFLSIGPYQEVSMVASGIKDDSASAIKAENLDAQMLPAIVVYGANASGKSNLLNVISFIKLAVVESHRSGSPKGGVPLTCFKLDAKYRNSNAKFDIDFVNSGVRYHYGFTANEKEFLEEWLYAYPKQKKQVYFYRQTGEKTYFSKRLRPSLKPIESIVRPNSLFLSAAIQSNHEELADIANFFTNISICEDEYSPITVSELYSSDKLDGRIIEFLKNADTGIAEYKLDNVPKSPAGDEFFKEFIQLIQKHGMPEAHLRETKKRLKLGHLTKRGNIQFFDLHFESRGTIRILSLLKYVFESIAKGSLLIVDELDSSLHTYLSEKILRFYNDPTFNKRGAQLLATTHDTNLLNTKILRRDQVWFAEKDDSGASHFYPLSDIRTKNTDNIEKGYLQGRFGAVPYRRSLKIFGGT